MGVQEKEITMSFTQAFNSTSDQTIASVSIGIPKVGEAFYTASYGGEKLDHASPSTSPSLDTKFTI